MITPRDIIKPSNVSGYAHVTWVRGPSRANTTSYYQAYDGRVGANHEWKGPRRATALEAAQDYCDRVNGRPLGAHSASLKSAGHKRRPRTPRKGPTAAEKRIAELEKELRDLKRQREKESSGRQGYVYCIGEDLTDDRYRHYLSTDAGYVVTADITITTTHGRNTVPANAFIIGARGVKIGHAVDPHKRIAELQTGNPRKLILLGFIKGTMEDEARLHQRFHKDNVLQEWFRPSRELLSLFVNKEG